MCIATTIKPNFCPENCEDSNCQDCEVWFWRNIIKQFGFDGYVLGRIVADNYRPNRRIMTRKAFLQTIKNELVRLNNN